MLDWVRRTWEDLRGIEGAGARIVDETVHEAIDTVTFL
jgi:hypothetical protein